MVATKWVSINFGGQQLYQAFFTTIAAWSQKLVIGRKVILVIGKNTILGDWTTCHLKLMDQWRIKIGIRKYLEANENKSTSFQILWDAAKAVQGGKFIVMQAYIKKQEKSQQPNQV